MDVCKRALCSICKCLQWLTPKISVAIFHRFFFPPGFYSGPAFLPQASSCLVLILGFGMAVVWWLIWIPLHLLLYLLPVLPHGRWGWILWIPRKLGSPILHHYVAVNIYEL